MEYTDEQIEQMVSEYEAQMDWANIQGDMVTQEWQGDFPSAFGPP